jgi:hypothetical protein
VQHKKNFKNRLISRPGRERKRNGRGRQEMRRKRNREQGKI